VFERLAIALNLPKRLALLACLTFAFLALAPALPGHPGAAYAKDGGSGGDGGGSGGGGGRGSGGDNSGPGSSDDDGGDDDSDSGKGRRDGASKGDSVSRYLKALRTQGRVASAKANGNSIEIRYSDGWRESVNGDRYRLFDPKGRRVVERPVVRDDIRRLRAAAQ